MLNNQSIFKKNIDNKNVFGYIAKEPNERLIIMDTKTKEKYETRARIIKALAHPTRLFIVDELSRNEKCVCELTAMIGADISTVSKHLSILKNLGIVDVDKRGLQVYYRLRTTCVMSFFDCCDMVMKKNTAD
jgi:DNA-binding transcriptional ArsR family regulator